MAYCKFYSAVFTCACHTCVYHSLVTGVESVAVMVYSDAQWPPGDTCVSPYAAITQHLSLPGQSIPGLSPVSSAQAQEPGLCLKIPGLAEFLLRPNN